MKEEERRLKNVSNLQIQNGGRSRDLEVCRAQLWEIDVC